MSVEEGDALIKQVDTLLDQIRAFPFPALVEEEVVDDGETFKALRCPRCGGLVADDELISVDASFRYNYAEAPDDAAFTYRDLQFEGSDSDYDETIYYRHGDNPGHAVSLPEGWTESWT